MSDEIDRETERLEFLMTQKLKRQADIIAANSDLTSKPKHVQVIPKIIWPKDEEED